MNKKGKLALSLTLAGTLIGLLGVVTPSSAVDPSAAVVINPPYLSYATKFVCGSTPNPSTATIEGTDVVKGMYKTAVNIHNPQAKRVDFFKKAVVAFPERSTTKGPISNIKQEFLDSDQAMEVDCQDIRSLFPSGVTLNTHIEGFVVIMVTPDAASGMVRELDVWGKYTARHRNNASGIPDVTTDVESIDIIQVQPIRVAQ
ncbi:MAG: hypothetical protein HZA08_01220 [Nitrospirae bacterium]|nr:hypothetical protein [Nitrospirota bacterium]